MYNYIHMYMYMYMYFYRKVLSCTCKTSAKETRQGKATTPEDSYYFQRQKGCLSGTRTHDILHTVQMLYQLSY